MKATIINIKGNLVKYLPDGSNEAQELELEDWVKPSFVKLGEAEISIKDNKISFVSMKTDGVQQKTYQKEFPKDSKKTGKWEDDMVTFETLLTKAHDLGKSFSIKTEMLQLDLEKKFALFKAKIEVFDERTNLLTVFEAHGDATEENVTGDFIKPHWIRMGETRSIVRALRWYTNNGVAEEEKQDY